MASFTVLYSADANTKLLLAYFYALAKTIQPKTTCVINAEDLYDIAKGYLRQQQMSSSDTLLLGLGPGKYVLVDPETGTPFAVEIGHVDPQTVTVLKSHFASKHNEVLFCVSIEIRMDILQLLRQAHDFIKGRLMSKVHGVKKYIFNASCRAWEMLDFVPHRSLGSLFLPNTEKEKLVEFVKDFFDERTKEEYAMHNMPYKCNVLFYGVPGSGKTSTIQMIASMLHVNIGMIPVCDELDDQALVNAISSAKCNHCSIIVLEDIDCLFVERKSGDTRKNRLTLSGLLNCFDGLYRDEGLMLFATANNVDFVDSALLRSGRIDYRLYFGYAHMSQVRQCFLSYFGDSLVDAFVERMEGKRFTLAALQSFLFKNRKAENILDVEFIIPDDSVISESSMYM